MEEKFDELLVAKEWSELTQQEKDFALTVVASAEEYASMRKVTLALLASPKAEISPAKTVLPKVLSRLKSSDAQTSLLERILGYRMPALLAVALVILAAAITAFALSPTAGENRLTVAPAEKIIVKTDTVYVERRPDTVYVNRVVYKYIATGKPSAVLTSATTEEAPAQGVTMKEKEELQGLLVTGVE
jgi:hypothetical protein